MATLTHFLTLTAFCENQVILESFGKLFFLIALPMPLPDFIHSLSTQTVITIYDKRSIILIDNFP